MTARPYVAGRATAKPAPRKGQEQTAKASGPSPVVLIAANTLPIAAGHKITRTKCALGTVKQHSIRANRLIAGMFNDNRFAKQTSEHQRRKRRPCGMDNVRVANQFC